MDDLPSWLRHDILVVGVMKYVREMCTQLQPKLRAVTVSKGISVDVDTTVQEVKNDADTEQSAVNSIKLAWTIVLLHLLEDFVAIQFPLATLSSTVATNRKIQSLYRIRGSRQH